LHHSPLTIIAETDCSQLVAATIFVPIKIAWLLTWLKAYLILNTPK
jgi:hypothetical protein